MYYLKSCCHFVSQVTSLTNNQFVYVSFLTSSLCNAIYVQTSLLSKQVKFFPKRMIGRGKGRQKLLPNNSLEEKILLCASVFPEHSFPRSQTASGNALSPRSLIHFFPWPVSNRIFVSLVILSQAADGGNIVCICVMISII